MNRSTREKHHILITADIEDHGQFDPSTLVDGLRQGIDIARGRAMLTTLDDESTLIRDLSVVRGRYPAQIVQSLLADQIEITPESLPAIQDALSRIAGDFDKNRSKILSDAERALLIKGVVLRTENDEANDPGFIKTVIQSGHPALERAQDEMLIEMAFVSSNCMSLFSDDDFLAALQLMCDKPEVHRLILLFGGALGGSLVDDLEDAAECLAPDKQPRAHALIEAVRAIMDERETDRDQQSESPAM